LQALQPEALCNQFTPAAILYSLFEFMPADTIDLYRSLVAEVFMSTRE
jgi:hypothetical protein